MSFIIICEQQCLMPLLDLQVIVIYLNLVYIFSVQYTQYSKFPALNTSS